MKEYLKAVDIANNVRMMRPLHKGAILILEGCDDSRVYSRFINSNECKLVIGYGKDNALGALKILEKSNFLGVLAIVDSDFWKLDDVTPSSFNILFTDTHDLETMIIKSPAFEKILGEYGSEKKIKAFVKQAGADLRTALLERIKPMGCLQWYSLREELELDFEGLVFSKFVDKNTLILDVLRMIKTVINHSAKPKLDAKDIRDALQELCSNGHDLWHVCCGHDVVNFLTIGLLKVLGSHSSSTLKSDEVERSLRLAYEGAYFSETELYKALLYWQENNSPFSVL